MDKKPKLIKTFVYILPDKDAGVASVVRNLLRFKTNRYSTKVLLIHNLLDDAKRRVQDDFNADDIVRITYNGKWSSNYSIHKKIINEIDLNSIVVSNDGGIELNSIQYIDYPIPVVYILHGDFKHYFSVLTEKQNSVSTVITVSDYLKNKLLKSFYRASDFDVESIKFPVPKSKLYKRISNSVIKLIFVGLLSDRKGVMSLFDIANLLDKRSVNYHLSIIGEGPKEFELKTLFKDNNKVSFLGKLHNHEVFDFYSQNDIILLPSKGEGLPVVIVEAMKYGVVPITTQLESGIPELIENAINGFTVKLGDYNGYATYIEQLHSDREQLKKMSELCIIKSEQMFDPFDQAKSYEDTMSLAEPVVFKNRLSFNVLDKLPSFISIKIKEIIKK
jgi:glycosyltransferase involved in cell wall biosynthesis